MDFGVTDKAPEALVEGYEERHVPVALVG